MLLLGCLKSQLPGLERSQAHRDLAKAKKRWVEMALSLERRAGMVSPRRKCFSRTAQANLAHDLALPTHSLLIPYLLIPYSFPTNSFPGGSFQLLPWRFIRPPGPGSFLFSFPPRFLAPIDRSPASETFSRRGAHGAALHVWGGALRLHRGDLRGHHRHLHLQLRPGPTAGGGGPTGRPTGGDRLGETDRGRFWGGFGAGTLRTPRGARVA